MLLIVSLILIGFMCSMRIVALHMVERDKYIVQNVMRKLEEEILLLFVRDVM
ncbi:TPA: hypothetical protein ACOQ31_006237 [Bacillus cereus]|uniref:hypothetical protein n=1 Tax=Bacillus cereus TaxID=1396 RepID=UPI0019261745|nr:hypothetical protein [Bacillus cereus]MBL3766311.1 hypothetical protein [Bacillus cereus]MBL3772398.1 hypothetical protein [Bacillus cereus]MBL3778411.1 hypothetical protein [Bacillus cereus]MBL3789468.1 hypothetical protein [Bacillus cereus]